MQKAIDRGFYLENLSEFGKTSEFCTVKERRNKAWKIFLSSWKGSLLGIILLLNGSLKPQAWMGKIGNEYRILKCLHHNALWTLEHVDMHDFEVMKVPMESRHTVRSDFDDLNALLADDQHIKVDAVGKIAGRWNWIYGAACAGSNNKVFIIIDTSKKGNKHLRLIKDDSII